MIATLLIAGAILALAPSSAVTAERCLSITEARKLWPRDHLYWSPTSGKRCWSNKRGRSASIPVVTHAPPPRPAPPSIDVPPSLVPPRWRDLAPPPPPSILDSPKWAWVADARGVNTGLIDTHPPSGTVVFSTFPGEPPDVWPPLEQHTSGVATYGMAAILAMLAAGAFWVVWGYPGRVRPEKSPLAPPRRHVAVWWNNRKVFRYG